MEYLKQYRRVTYTNFLINGKPNAYLFDIDKQAQGITEQLKAENALEWTGKAKTFGFVPKSRLLRNPNIFLQKSFIIKRFAEKFEFLISLDFREDV